MHYHMFVPKSQIILIHLRQTLHPKVKLGGQNERRNKEKELMTL